MKSFTDNLGRAWTLVVNVATIKRVRALFGVDLNSIIEVEDGKPTTKLLERLSTDPVLLEDALPAVRPDGGRDGAVSLEARPLFLLHPEPLGGEQDGVGPLAEEAGRQLVQPGRVSVVGGVLRVLEPLHLAVGDDDDNHAAQFPEVVEQADNLPPVGQGVDIALAVAAVRLLDGADSEVLADPVPDEPLQPVGGIKRHGLELVRLVAERGKILQHVVQRLRQGELGGVDFAETVLGLDEDRVRCLGGGAAFAHALLTVEEDSGRLVLLPSGDAFKQ